MGIISFKKQSAASVQLPPADQLRLFVDSADDILKTKDSAGVVRPSGVGTADELATTGSPVDVSASAPPVMGSILTADTPTAATWKDPGTIYFTGSPVIQTAVVVGPTTQGASIGELVRVDISGGNVTIDLPTAVGNTNREVWVKLVSVVATFSCTIDGAGAEAIDGSPTLVLNTDYEWATLRSDGANWMQLG